MTQSTSKDNVPARKEVGGLMLKMPLSVVMSENLGFHCG
jgi:hypothetical protein